MLTSGKGNISQLDWESFPLGIGNIFHTEISHSRNEKVVQKELEQAQLGAPHSEIQGELD